MKTLLVWKPVDRRQPRDVKISVQAAIALVYTGGLEMQNGPLDTRLCHLRTIQERLLMSKCGRNVVPATYNKSGAVWKTHTHVHVSVRASPMLSCQA